MSAARRKRVRRAAAKTPAAESTVYDGSKMLGTIVERNRTFRAIDANGRKLGSFPNARDAMRAISTAARAPSEAPKSQPAARGASLNA